MKKIIIFNLLCMIMIAFNGCKTESNTNSNNDSTNASPSFDESENVSKEEAPSFSFTPEKFELYNTVTEENGKNIITIYSEEQLSDFQARRNDGEVFSLTAQEIQFIIDNTYELFNNYDIIFVRDIDGNLNKYYGIKFYTSDDYYRGFNTIENVIPDASYDLRADVMKAAFDRMEMLNTSIVTNAELATVVFSDASEIPETKLTQLANHAKDIIYDMATASTKNAVKNYPISIYYFDFPDRMFECIDDLSKSDTALITKLTNEERFPEWIGKTKYDSFQKNVVVELYEDDGDKLIARMRIDEANTPMEYAELSKRIADFQTVEGTNDEPKDIEKYRAVVYVNGTSFMSLQRTNSFVYSPDGDLNSFYISDPSLALNHNYKMQLKGVKSITEYLNELMKSFIK